MPIRRGEKCRQRMLANGRVRWHEIAVEIGKNCRKMSTGGSAPCAR